MTSRPTMRCRSPARRSRSIVLAALATVLPAAASARTDPLVALRTQD